MRILSTSVSPITNSKRKMTPCINSTNYNSIVLIKSLTYRYAACMVHQWSYPLYACRIYVTIDIITWSHSAAPLRQGHFHTFWGVTTGAQSWKSLTPGIQANATPAHWGLGRPVTKHAAETPPAFQLQHIEHCQTCSLLLSSFVCILWHAGADKTPRWPHLNWSHATAVFIAADRLGLGQSLHEHVQERLFDLPSKQQINEAIQWRGVRKCLNPTFQMASQQIRL